MGTTKNNMLNRTNKLVNGLSYFYGNDNDIVTDIDIVNGIDSGNSYGYGF